MAFETSAMVERAHPQTTTPVSTTAHHLDATQYAEWLSRTLVDQLVAPES